MRLEKIKLVGFKSFVDPTTVEFPSNLVGIVGPNGCGKSNVIDAVRWVMGESSAKNLRGESITDVIFNGTVNRKPIGQCSIELMFENAEGRLGGEYAKYSNISIKRQVNRDAQSTYFLNGVRCRRRDITDVFLGTGLGPRSYSIIEQGMISKLIEAKPEEFRVHLEEVSGISKYKERRRETENRIKHTKENLDRLHDLHEEIDKQLEKLKRQSNAAERFKVLKEEERTLRAQSQATRWAVLHEQVEHSDQFITEGETKLHAKQAEQQNIDTQITQLREAKHDLTEAHNVVQSQYYGLGSEVTKLEQAMQHFKERQTQLTMDLEQAETAWRDAKHHFEQDQANLKVANEEYGQLEPGLNSAQEELEGLKESLANAEEQMRSWQLEWDQFNEDAAESSQTAQVEQTRIQHIEETQMQAKRRIEAIVEEQAQIDTGKFKESLQALTEESAELEQRLSEQESKLETNAHHLSEKRQAQSDLSCSLDEMRSELQAAKGRFSSLEALQQEALGKQSSGVAADWLSQNQLQDSQRLAQSLKVKSGWESVVEVVLGPYLEAVCTDRVNSLASHLAELTEGAVTLFDTSSHVVTGTLKALPKLSEHVEGPQALLSMLESVYVANDVQHALQLQSDLAAHESVVCPEGLWLGRNWARISKSTDVKSGILLREQEMEKTQARIQTLESGIDEKREALEACQRDLENLERERETFQESLNESKSKMADVKAQMSVKQSRIEQLTQRNNRLEKEAGELREQLQVSHDELSGAKTTWQDAMNSMEHNADRRETLLRQRDEYRERLGDAQQKTRESRERLHQIELRAQVLESQKQSLTQNIERMEQQQANLQARCEQLTEALSHGDSPLEEMQAELDQALEKRLGVEAELTSAKTKLDESEHRMRELEEARYRIDQEIQDARSALEQKRLKIQEVKVRCTTIEEQMQESGFDIQEVLKEIPEEMDEKTLLENLERTTNKIQRLGPINLAAIDEYQEQLERKEYLSAQLTDLEEALNTLENAIRKIDKETREKFKETYDTVNAHFQEYFPKIFGGGSAHLELTGDDLLSTGVSVMARPPGKKNSTIHLLSGGEKALTAIALVFSMFQLNPAPFCMLDEVDAPLDDANVGRYVRLVQEMSDKVQFIFISHNKLAIEMAKHLTGVTMHEPGVSRIVSVDMDEAVAMAEA